jgi:hypothetical protein
VKEGVEKRSAFNVILLASRALRYPFHNSWAFLTTSQHNNFLEASVCHHSLTPGSGKREVSEYSATSLRGCYLYPVQERRISAEKSHVAIPEESSPIHEPTYIPRVMQPALQEQEAGKAGAGIADEADAGVGRCVSGEIFVALTFGRQTFRCC